jgi:phosphoribosylformimino-5-aminoimidazole carboxamide ribotide isomerase
MIVIPAVDLRDGACVQLVGGRYDREAVRLDNPLAVARQWAALGFQRLHVVDLDGATGRGENRAVVARLLADQPALELQVGGGVRSRAALEGWLEAGARQVVIGTRALDDPAWLEGVAQDHAGRLIVAVDVRDGAVVADGWTRPVARTLEDVLRSLDPLPLAALLVTAVHREGLLGGPDLALVDRIGAGTRHPLIASGGIATFEQLEALRRLGVSAVVLGMALYTGALDARRLVEEYST